MGLKLTALIWGLAEATFFFIVPDVLLTFVCLKDRRQATRLCFWALGGALAGGVIMFTWGAIQKDSAVHLLEHVPAISQPLIEEIDHQVKTHGAMATLAGPLAGKPYKVYAVQAGAAGVSLPVFLLISIPARLLRFLLATWASSVIFNGIFRTMGPGKRQLLLCCAWIAFYFWFFSIM
jgi:membrane protein YqaA with SNARE-associated domain